MYFAEPPSLRDLQQVSEDLAATLHENTTITQLDL